MDVAKRNPLVGEAYEMYKSGVPLVEIAKKLKLPAGTVRRWKSTYKWGESTKQTSERSHKVSERSHKEQHAPQTSQCTGDEKGGLTPEQQLFCALYVKTFNATQSYMKVYKCSYESAMANASRLIRLDKVKAEIEHLKQEKKEQLLCGEEDLVELHMRIAFADIGDYIEFGRELQPVIGQYGPVKVKNPVTGKQEILQQYVNTVRLRESETVDTQLIKEIKQGREGVSIKLADAQKSSEWLSRYFLVNPMDKHKQEYDAKKLEIELLRMELAAKEGQPESTDNQSNFLDALNQNAKELWKDGESMAAGGEDKAASYKDDESECDSSQEKGDGEAL